MQARLTVEDLRQIPMFHGLDDSKLEKLLAIISYETYEPGVKLILDGEYGDCVYLLLKGEVEITKMMTMLPAQGFQAPEKSLIRLNGSFKPFIGELSLFDEQAKRTATVSTLTHVLVGVIKRHDFLVLADQDSEIGYHVMLNIARTMATRLQKANTDILKLTTAFSLAITRR
ncbi:MAG: cyclic nucleotide-binding domain-containing protein [Bacteroidetes bacterium]|nr:cyclic nucleotide-binding domain-containing protein [Bacteroidota bacterium]